MRVYGARDAPVALCGRVNRTAPLHVKDAYSCMQSINYRSDMLADSGGHAALTCTVPLQHGEQTPCIGLCSQQRQHLRSGGLGGREPLHCCPRGVLAEHRDVDAAGADAAGTAVARGSLARRASLRVWRRI